MKKGAAPGRLELVQAFLNTRDLEAGIERLDSPQALTAWLRSRRLLRRSEKAGPADLARALELREGVRAVLRAGDRQATEAGGVLDRAARRARVELRFDRAGRDRLDPSSTGPDQALGQILTALVAARADGTLSRLKTCADPGCEWAFFDHTRNRSGTWCDMAVCGNRAKVRAFRERH